ERIERIKCRGIAVHQELTMELIGAGLGENFDSSVSQLVVFGGERVLVDANLADRRLGRKLACRKSVDVNLSAVRPGRGTSQCLQLRLQLIGIVRQCVEIFAFQDEGSSAALGWADAKGGSLLLHLDVLLLDGNLQLDLELLRLAGGHSYAGFVVLRKAFGVDSDVVR